MPKVVIQKWEESERGWGTRPDGYTMHASEADREAFVREYWDKMPAAVPDEYSRPCGTPYEAEVDHELHARLTDAVAKGKRGAWVFEHECDRGYPGSGGADGWVKSKPAAT